ncbi:MAG: choice-of-anchor Q domain-containing protein [Kiritimatiellae bacterium]|nr:choice-of-anchor Q domain-containing protein [Kiritimatiellia bacterium]
MQKIVVALTSALMVCMAAADTHYVDLYNPVPVPPYTNGWSSAANTITAATAHAQTVAFDVVLVNTGVYVLGATITMNKSIDIIANSTNRQDVVVDGASAYRCFYFGSGVAITGSLQGFTIQHGLASDGDGGGGIRCYPGTAAGNRFTIANCTIVSNAATTGGGGGVWLFTNSVLTNCTVITNTSANPNGGGIVLSGGAVVRNCWIAQNISSGGNGGGVAFVWNAYCGVLRDSVISNNFSPSYGGGIYVTGKGMVDHCIIVDNYSAANGGGGVSAGGDSTVRDCTVVGNTAYGITGGGGGGVYVNDVCLVERCVIRGNVANSTTGTLGGGGLKSYGSGSIVRNCLIVGNTAVKEAGGVWVGYAGASNKGLTMENCTVVGNSAAGNGGGLWASTTVPLATNILLNTVFYGNTAGGSGSNWFGTVAFTVSNCCTIPTNALPGGNNLNADPLFAGQNSSNYHLTARSPCINAGFYSDWMTNAVDMDGRPRINQRYGGIVDIGAYEFIPQGALITLH